MSDRCPRCSAPNPTGRLGVCPRCLLEGDAAPWLVGGALELQEEIGRGGMGTVYKARHVRLGRTVAVKFLPPRLADQPEFRARFEREARALALLSHPNIVAVHDFGQEDGQGYLVMEYVEGRPLGALFPMPVDRAVEAVLQVCGALDTAHRQGVVHRDVKPENILVDASGLVKVTDFGIARIVRPDAPEPAVTTPDVTLGTPAYMAPEALAGAEPDPRMDVYSLGVVLYQAVTGSLPAGDFDPAPGGLDPVVRKALAPDPARRYAGAAEMARDLAAAARAGGRAADDLPPEERSFVQAVAILQSISTALALWAFLVSVTPKRFAAGEVLPLISLGNETLPDGRVLSRARFETGWTLVALGAFALALTAYGFLRRHWRLAGLERARPERPLRPAARVFWIGALAIAVYGVRRLLEDGGFAWATRYMPLLGGIIEVAALFLFWASVLEAWRTARPLRREPFLWAGCALALLPPVLELLRALRTWPV